MEADSSWSVFVSRGGVEMEFRCTDATTLEEFRDMLDQAFGVPADRQTLLMKGGRLPSAKVGSLTTATAY